MQIERASELNIFHSEQVNPLVRSFGHRSPWTKHTLTHSTAIILLLLVERLVCIDFLKLMYVVIVVVCAFGVTTVRWLLLLLLCCTVFAVYCVSCFRAHTLLPLLCGYYFYRFYYEFWAYAKLIKFVHRRGGTEDASIDLIRYLTRSRFVFAGRSTRVYWVYMCAPLHAIPK